MVRRACGYCGVLARPDGPGHTVYRRRPGSHRPVPTQGNLGSTARRYLHPFCQQICADLAVCYHRVLRHTLQGRGLAGAPSRADRMPLATINQNKFSFVQHLGCAPSAPASALASAIADPAGGVGRGAALPRGATPNGRTALPNARRRAGAPEYSVPRQSRGAVLNRRIFNPPWATGGSKG